MEYINVYNFLNYFKRPGDKRLARIGHVNEVIEKINEGGSGGGSAGVIENTYEELTILKSNNELIPGALYKITDFQTIYDQPDYTSGGSLKGTLVTKTASIDPIILFAISNNEFHITAYRPSTPNHKIEFDMSL